MNHVTHPMIPADISNFSPEISKFVYTKKYMYRLHLDTKFLILLTFLVSLRIILIKKVIILMMSAKILSRDSNYIVFVVMWPKFGNSNISMREVIIISTL